jgi:hypothetical protein
MNMPNVYTIGVQWAENIEVENDPHGQFKGESDKFDIERFFKMITFNLDLKDVYKM